MSEDYSLRNVSLAIKENQTIAIVGDNGSGKSTFIKVLIGLYPASEGRVYFGDREIKDINQESLWDNITVIFQDFVKFAYSLRENIAFSNINKIENQQRIRDVSKVTGIDKLVENLPEGYNTKLGKIHIDSIDISGGEWQKIALSRALFKDSNMIILDEPTASIDPKTEVSIFNEFANLVRNKTAILITHRMASARIADRIFVMSNGEIVEDGTHDELIKKQGLYCTMYKSQASGYK